MKPLEHQCFNNNPLASLYTHVTGQGLYVFSNSLTISARHYLSVIPDLIGDPGFFFIRL